MLFPYQPEEAPEAPASPCLPLLSTSQHLLSASLAKALSSYFPNWQVVYLLSVPSQLA